MGTSCSWIAVRGAEEDTLRVLHESGLELVRTHTVADLGEAGELVEPIRAEGRAQERSAWCPISSWTDAGWTVLQDSEMALADDESRLTALSQQVGDTLALTLATHSGIAGFSYFTAGERVRHVWYDGVDVETEGEALPQEEGIDVSCFYMDESEELWAAFGLTDYFVGTGPVRVHVLNDPELAARVATLPRGAPTKKAPWWKRWF